MTTAPGMSMNKLIHRAVRRDLRRFRSALEAFPEGDRDRAAALHRAWVNFDAQLTEHHHGEHEVVWPALDAIGIAAPTIASFDAEHEAMAADLATAREAMATLHGTATRSDAEAASDAMKQLETTTVTHLDHEEQQTEETLAQHQSHPAIKEMGKKFSRRTGPAKAGAFFAWIQDGATTEERAALRTHVPAPVAGVLAGVFGRRYRHDVAPVWATD